MDHTLSLKRSFHMFSPSGLFWVWSSGAHSLGTVMKLMNGKKTFRITALIREIHRSLVDSRRQYSIIRSFAVCFVVGLNRLPNEQYLMQIAELVVSVWGNQIFFRRLITTVWMAPLEGATSHSVCIIHFITHNPAWKMPTSIQIVRRLVMFC